MFLIVLNVKQIVIEMSHVSTSFPSCIHLICTFANFQIFVYPAGVSQACDSDVVSAVKCFSDSISLTFLILEQIP